MIKQAENWIRAIIGLVFFIFANLFLRWKKSGKITKWVAIPIIIVSLIGGGIFTYLVITKEEPAYASPTPTNAIDFERQSEEYAYASAPNIKNDTGDYTFECWFRLESAAGGNYLAITGIPGSAAEAGGHTTLRVNDNQKLYFQQRIGVGWKIITGNDALNTGTWYHVACVWDDDSEQRMYLDGVKQTATNDLSGVDAREARGTPTYYGDINIGISSEDGAKQVWDGVFDGTIDEFRYSDNVRYTENFTPSEIEFSNDANTLGLWHFNDDATDSSDNEYDLTTNSTTYVEGKVSAAGGERRRIIIE